MITINDPFIIALIFITFFAAAKWMEWFLFREGSGKARSVKKEYKAPKENGKLRMILGKLNEIFVFGRADLKRPWYLVVTSFLVYFSTFVIADNDFFSLPLYGRYALIGAACIFIGSLEICGMIRANRDYFSVGDRKRRYLRVQAAQAALALVVAVIVIGLLSYSTFHNEKDTEGLKESVDWVIEPKYEGSWPQFSEGLAAVGIQGKMGYIDRNGSIVIPRRYNDAEDFHEGLAAVQKKWKWGYIDQKGNVVIPFEYDEAYDFDGGIAPVKKDGKWSVIDNHGAVKFETDYPTIYPFNEGVAEVIVRDKKYPSLTTNNLIDAEGNLLFHKKSYDFSGFFSEGCIFTYDKESGKGFFLDKNEKKVISQDYVEATDFSGGVSAVYTQWGGYELIDHQGNTLRSLSEEEYNNYLFCNEGLIIDNNGKGLGHPGSDEIRYGLKDLYGNIMLPAVFREITPSSDGLIAIEVDGYWGFIENPLPKAARGIDPEFWKADQTQIATVESLPVYAGELESHAYDIEKKSPAMAGSSLYQKAFEEIKAEKASEKFGKNVDPDTIRYQIGDTYYKKLLLPDL